MRKPGELAPVWPFFLTVTIIIVAEIVAAVVFYLKVVK